MLKRCVVVGFMTVLGAGGLAAPSLAESSASAHDCDSLSPGCSFLLVQTPLSGPVLTVASFCTYPGLVPTVDDACVYAEVDYPTVP